MYILMALDKSDKERQQRIFLMVGPKLEISSLIITEDKFQTQLLVC